MRLAVTQKPLLWVEVGAHAVRKRSECAGVVWATPEDQRLAIARRAAEVKERRAIFAANANANADTPTNNP